MVQRYSKPVKCTSILLVCTKVQEQSETVHYTLLYSLEMQTVRRGFGPPRMSRIHPTSTGHGEPHHLLSWIRIDDSKDMICSRHWLWSVGVFLHISTMPDEALKAFLHHGVVSRTIDASTSEAAVWWSLAHLPSSLPNISTIKPGYLIIIWS